MCVREELWLLVTGNSGVRQHGSAGIHRHRRCRRRRRRRRRRRISSVRLFQVVEVLHQLLVVHAQVEVVQFDRVAVAGVLTRLLLLIGRGRGRGVEREHRVADDRRAFNVHRPPVARLHEQRVRVSLFGVVVRAVAVVVVAVVAGDRRSSAACVGGEKGINYKTRTKITS